MVLFGKVAPDPVDSDWREGKFDDLSTFLKADETMITNFKYRPATSAGIRPGSIIHIKDRNPESRIHNRVLLVKSTNAYCMICFSFCQHRPHVMESDAPIHWQAVAKGTPYQGDSSLGLGMLELRLAYELSPQQEVTINLRDPWNVEWDTSVTKLGEVTGQAWIEVKNKMIQIFSLDEQYSDHTPFSSPQECPLTYEGENPGILSSSGQPKHMGPSPKIDHQKKRKALEQHGKCCRR